MTPHGFKFGPVTVEAKGRAYHCSLCPTFVVYDDKDLILDHIEMVHFGETCIACLLTDVPYLYDNKIAIL